MKKIPLFLSLFLTLMLVPSVSAQKEKKKKKNIFKELFGVSVDEKTNKFEGTTTYQMYGNRVNSKLSSNNAVGNLIFGINTPTYNTFLNLEKHIPKDGEYELAILLKVEAKNEVTVDIKEGESLILLLDDERINLNTEGAFNSDFDVSNSTSVVNTRYAISKEQLEKINGSDTVEFRIILDSFRSGNAKERDKEDLYLDGEFKKKNKKAWVEFYDDYLKDKA
ncbi:MAG: hypothetical protein AAGC64_04540 [Bacteroidota bacterium]